MLQWVAFVLWGRVPDTVFPIGWRAQDDESCKQWQRENSQQFVMANRSLSGKLSELPSQS